MLTLSGLRAHLTRAPHLRLVLPDGTAVPAHAHLTEVGESTRRFIDCGGTVRHQRSVTLQFWVASDLEHRLTPARAAEILERAQTDLGLADLPVEVEYQGHDTIQRYGLSADGSDLHLTGLHTACLAPDRCGLPTNSGSVQTSPTLELAACTPGGGCC